MFSWPAERQLASFCAGSFQDAVCLRAQQTGPVASASMHGSARHCLLCLCALLALCGLVEIIVVDLASVVAIALANGHGTTGTIVIFNYATQVFTSVSAVLAISVVLSAFPVLSARDGPEFDPACFAELVQFIEELPF